MLKKTIIPWNLTEALVTTTYAFLTTSTAILIFSHFLHFFSIDPNAYYKTFFQLALPASICCFACTLIFFPRKKPLTRERLFKILLIITIAIIASLSALIITSSPKLCQDLLIGKPRAYHIALMIVAALLFFVPLANMTGGFFYIFCLRPFLVRWNVVQPLDGETGKVCKL